MPADQNWDDSKGEYIKPDDPRYVSPDSNVSPYAHAVRHLDRAEDGMKGWYEKSQPQVFSDALIGIGWALLAIARKR